MRGATNKRGEADSVIRWPNDEDVAQGVHLISWIGPGYDDPGKILDRKGATRWQYEVSPKPWRFSPINLFLRSDFLVKSPEGQEVLRLRRITRIFPSFEMIKVGQIAGKLAYRSILRTSCTLELKAGPTWTFRQPLFSVSFFGSSNAGNRVWIRVGPSSKRQWNLLTQAGADDLYLLSAIAFMHREYWTH